jgi:predicted nucleotidyltransferase
MFITEVLKMIYPHQQNAIDYISNKFKKDSQILALLLSGSIPHGFNDGNSDIDLNIIISKKLYEQKKNEQALTYWESADNFYLGGYFDGKYISFDYLDMVLKKGNEPTRFALQDSIILFDNTGKVANYIEQIGTYNEGTILDNSIRFLSQFEAWYWYCKEALLKQNEYLLNLSVSKLILFAGRLILIDNRVFFPYHKWFIKMLEKVPKKPPEYLYIVNELLNNKSKENIDALYNSVKNYKDWSNGSQFNWASHFLHDIETVWMRGEEFIENI